MNSKPFLPTELRGVLPWRLLAAALNRDVRHCYRAVAVVVAVVIVLMVLAPDAWAAVLRYCNGQAAAWRESEVRELLVKRYGVRPESLERTE